GAGAKDTVAAVIGEGMRAYTIAISDVAGVGGHAMPGDRVDVVLTRELPQPPARNGTPVCGECKRVLADVVLQDVRVLGMDLNADPSSTKAAVAHTATLEVTVQDAEKLAVAAQAGSLSLALRRTGNAEVTPVQAMDVADLGGAGPARVTPVASRKPVGAGRPALIRTHAVTVFNGDAPTSIQVPAEAFGAGA
ncbi:MAG: Flp pilus assembly protein CpaB, partial [Caulobacteraceae bacterium]